MTGYRLKKVVAALAAALGAVAVVASELLAGPVQGKVVTGNLPVNKSAFRQGDFSAHNSPTVVQSPLDPARIVVANRIDSPGFSCALHVSQDAGETFEAADLPLRDGVDGPCFAADASFGGDGTLYVSYVTLTGLANAPEALWLATSEDGGETFTSPSKVAGELAFQARVVADPQVAGRVYLTWLQAADVALLAFPEAGYPIHAVRSDDGGRTWTDPVEVNDPARQRVVAPAPVVDRRGHLLVAYLDLMEDRLDYNGGHGGQGGPPYQGPWQLILARSSDGGRSWAETVVDELVPAERFVVFLPPFPSVAVDPSGQHVYVAFGQAPFGDPDVFLWHSDDGGVSFGEPVRVNDTNEADGSTQTLPKIAVSPEGRVDLLYYDRRDDPEDVRNEVSLQSSDDEGLSFGPHVTLSDRSFDARIGFGGERGLPDLGSRLGLVAMDDIAIAVWTDTRTGTRASHKQDLVRAVVSFGDLPPLDAAAAYRLRIGGIAIVLIGLVMLTTWADTRSPLRGDEPRSHV